MERGFLRAGEADIPPWGGRFIYTRCYSLPLDGDYGQADCVNSVLMPYCTLYRCCSNDSTRAYSNRRLVVQTGIYRPVKRSERYRGIIHASSYHNRRRGVQRLDVRPEAWYCTYTTNRVLQQDSIGDVLRLRPRIIRPHNGTATIRGLSAYNVLTCGLECGMMQPKRKYIPRVSTRSLPRYHIDAPDGCLRTPTLPGHLCICTTMEQWTRVQRDSLVYIYGRYMYTIQAFMTFYDAGALHL